MTFALINNFYISYSKLNIMKTVGRNIIHELCCRFHTYTLYISYELLHFFLTTNFLTEDLKLVKFLLVFIFSITTDQGCLLGHYKFRIYPENSEISIFAFFSIAKYNKNQCLKFREKIQNSCIKMEAKSNTPIQISYNHFKGNVPLS